MLAMPFRDLNLDFPAGVWLCTTYAIWTYGEAASGGHGYRPDATLVAVLVHSALRALTGHVSGTHPSAPRVALKRSAGA